MEWMNGAFNRIDKNMLYLLQQGVPEWSEKVTYPVNAIIKYNGVLYTAIVKNENSKPTSSTTKWKKTQVEIPKASTNQVGIVKLSSATNSTSETEAATPLAVKNTYDLAGQAKWHAVNNAVQKTQKINGKQLSGDISLSALDVGALSIRDFNSVLIGNAEFFTNYYEILLPIAFPHNSDCVNVTLASATFGQQSPMAGNSVYANLSGSPTKLTIAVTSSVLGYAPTVHYEIIGH